MGARNAVNASLVAAVLCLGPSACSTESPEPSEAPTAEAPTAWDGDFTFGPHTVGFRTETITRPGPEGEREIVLSVWYPAESHEEGEVVRVGDYFRGVLQEGLLEETNGLEEPAAFAAAMTGAATALSTEAALAGLDAPTMARVNAPPAAGRYPVALWSSRHATLLAQAPLSEVLASHGFVVATAWSSDPPLAFLWEDRSPEDKIETIETHTGDLERALAELRRDPVVNGDAVVVLAWSYGGQTAARLQEREASVRGVIGMDANVLPARVEESLELRRPLVYLVGRDTSGRGFERLEGLGAPWTAVRFADLTHGSFNAMEGYLPAALGTDTVYSWSQRGAVARDGYRALVRVVGTAARSLAADDPPSAEQMSSLLQAAAGDANVELSAAGDDG